MGNPFATRALGAPPDDPATASVRWEKEGAPAWKLVRMASCNDQVFPPGQTVLLCRNDIDSNSGARPIVVLGEAGSGITSLCRWIASGAGTRESDRPGFVRLDAGSLPAGTDEAEAQRRLVGQLAGRLDGFDEPNEGASIVRALEFLGQDQPGGPLVVLFEGLQGLDPPMAERLFGQLRALVEERRAPGLRLVVTAETEDRLNPGEFSSFLSISDVYRPPSFERREIDELWRRSGKGKPGSADVARECCAWTGGQPLIVQLFLSRLFDRPDDLARIGPELISNPPATLTRWQSRLAAITRHRVALRERMRAYVKGTTESDARATSELEPLYIAGWIRRDAETCRWGIRSKAHAEWARGPLLHPERFLSVGRAPAGGGRP